MTEGRAERSRDASRRAFQLVNLLLQGQQPTVDEASAAIGVQAPRVRELMKELKREVDCAEFTGSHPKRIRLMGVRQGTPSHEMAIGACLAASLAPLFAGTVLESGVIDGLRYVIDASPSAAKFSEIERKFFFVGRGGESGLPRNAKQLKLLTMAILEQREITLTHSRFDPDAPDGRKTYQPLSLAIYNHQLYVIGRRPTDKAIRLLRFSRIKNLRVLRSRTFEYPAEHEFSPRQLYRDAFGVYLGAPDAPVEQVEVRLTKKWKAYAKDHCWHASQKVSVTDDGVLVRLAVRVCAELEAWVLSFGEEAEVIAPASLRERVASRATSMAAVYSAATTVTPVHE